MHDKSKIVISLKALLNPVAHFCLRHGLKIQDIEKALKVVMLEAATKELTAQDRTVNNSTLSATTGIARKLIGNATKLDESDSGEFGLLTKIVGQWQNSAVFQDSKGRPRQLNAEGVDSEFSDLVRSITLDLNSYTILSEMLRLGLVKKVGKKVKLQFKINLIRKLPEAMRLVGDDFQTLQMAAEENIQAKEPQHLHLTTRYDNISGSAQKEIQKWLINEGSAFHRKARAFLSKFDRDINPSQKDKSPERFKVSVCAFSFLEKIGVSETRNQKKGSK